MTVTPLSGVNYGPVRYISPRFWWDAGNARQVSNSRFTTSRGGMGGSDESYGRFTW